MIIVSAMFPVGCANEETMTGDTHMQQEFPKNLCPVESWSLKTTLHWGTRRISTPWVSLFSPWCRRWAWTLLQVPGMGHPMYPSFWLLEMLTSTLRVRRVDFQSRWFDEHMAGLTTESGFSCGKLESAPFLFLGGSLCSIPAFFCREKLEQIFEITATCFLTFSNHKGLKNRV